MNLQKEHAKQLKIQEENQYKQLESEVQRKIGIASWEEISGSDEMANVKSWQALDNYDFIKFFKENKEK